MEYIFSVCVYTTKEQSVESESGFGGGFKGCEKLDLSSRLVWYIGNSGGLGELTRSEKILKIRFLWTLF